MENLRATDIEVATDYEPMRSCDSDDSQSNGSHSEDNEAIPGIIYTSDDSADVGQSDSTYVDSDTPNYIAQNVNPKMEDEISQQLLLEGDMNSSPQPSPQVGDPFIIHPLSPVGMSLTPGKDLGVLGQGKKQMYCERPIVHLQVNPGESVGLTRSNSMSSSSTEAEFTTETPFLCRYEPLPMYPEDESYIGGLKFDALQDDPVKSKVMVHGGRFYVGDVPIDARYRDAFFVKWNWPRIRQTCVFINLSFLIGFLCVGIGLVIQMPKGSDCNPVQDWWQGAVSYRIFVPSFLDSNGTGFGDLSGVLERLDYLQGLGVRTVQLSSVFPCDSFIDKGSPPTDYKKVSPLLGDMRDFHLLTALLHERDMFLVLDMPLARKTETGEAIPAMDLEVDVVPVLNYWMNFGVDGFAFTDLDELAHLERQLINASHAWRNCLDARSRGLYKRIMSVPGDLVKKFEQSSPLLVDKVLRLFDLIDVYLDLSQTSNEVVMNINHVTRWDDHASHPWINWNIGGPFQPRIADVAQGPMATEADIPTLGFSLFQLFLPGSVTLYYGDEIGLTIGDKFNRDLSWATPLAWSPTDGSFSKGEPWLEMGEYWQERNVATLNQSLNPLRTMIKASQEQVPLYINGIFEDVGDFHPVKSSNYKIPYASEDLLIFDRFYPRKNKFAVVINLGHNVVERDLSKLYYGGRVLASTHGKEGYVRFKNITLLPMETLALILDK